MNDSKDPLGAIDWYQSLPVGSRRILSRHIRMRIYRRERAIYYQDEPVEAVYVLGSGEVNIVKWRSDGSSFVLGKAYPGDWIGLAEAISVATYLSDCIPTTQTTVALIPTTHLD